MKHLIRIFAITLLVIIASGNNSQLFAQNADKLFQQGLIKEEGEGMLQEAIDLFHQVVNDESADRNLRAKALLHTAYCYEKLGQEKAKESYERLVSDFSDQQDVASIGKKKLKLMAQVQTAKPATGIVVKEIWSNAEDTYGISPDGRYMNYIDWRKIEIAIKDLVTGKTWYLTDRGTWKPPMQFPDMSIWSPDGKKLAYYWYNGDSTELHIINRDGSNDYILSKGKGNSTTWPVKWSANGDFILGFRSSGEDTNPEDMSNEVVLVSVKDGSVKVLKDFTGLQSGCCGTISPDGKFVAYANQQAADENQNDIYIQSVDGSYFDRVVEDPANDKNPIWAPDGNALLFMSDRNGTNDLWKLNLEKGVPTGNPEIVYSNMGKTSLLGFARDGSLYYSSSHLRADVYTSKINLETGEVMSTPMKISVPENRFNIKPIWSPDGRYVAFLDYERETNKILGDNFRFIIHDTQTNTIRRLNSDLYGGVRGYWNYPVWSPDGKNLLVQARTEDKLQGFFLLDVNTGKHSPLLVKPREPRSSMTPIGNFPRFSADGKDIYYLQADKKELIKRNLSSGKEKTIYSDDEEILHYQLTKDESKFAFGYFFKDRNAIYMVDTKTGEKTKVAGFEKGITPYILDWSDDNSKIFFTKGGYADDSSPEIWSVPSVGGEPLMVVDLNEIAGNGVVRELDVMPSNNKITASLVTGSWLDIWAMENIFHK